MTSPNDRATVEAFYRCFAAKDGAGMAACYAADATFSDPVFPSLRGPEVGAMWEMITSRAQDFTLTLDEVRDEDSRVVARWTAHYTFTGTGRSVVNHVTSTLRIVEGKIAQQRDDFDFRAWQAQALGAFGRLLGWTGLPGRIVRNGAAKNLAAYRRARATPIA